MCRDCHLWPMARLYHPLSHWMAPLGGLQDHVIRQGLHHPPMTKFWASLDSGVQTVESPWSASISHLEGASSQLAGMPLQNTSPFWHIWS